MKKLILILILTAVTGLAQPVSNSGVSEGVSARYTLLGMIGQSYLIRMELERSGEILKGSYFYERTGVVRPGSKRIDLAGRIDSTGRFSLLETTELDGLSVPRRTGEFTGVLTAVVVDGQSLHHLTGTWTRARDGRKMPFTVDEPKLPRDSASGVLRSREQRENDRSLNYSLHLNLPVLGRAGSSFNRHLARIVEPLAAEFKKDVAELRRDEEGRRNEVPPSSFEIDYVIVIATPELLSLQLSIYSYTGGAHPNAQSRSINWDLRHERELALADLFTPGAAYGRILSDYSRRELARLDLGDPEWLTRGTTFTQENYHRWNPTRAGLRITFDQYQVAAYAQGSFEVVIPWPLLRSLMRRGLLSLTDKSL
jgi:hypothetical protein